MGNLESPDVLIREPMVEGIWYPEAKEELMDALHHSMIQGAHQSASGIMVPFGPMDQVSECMGKAFASLKGKTWERALVLGPCTMHRRSKVYLPESTHFRTPLGLSPVDLDGLDLMLDSSLLMERNDVPHLEENGLELSIAYLHYLYPDLPVLPVLIGETNEALFRTLAGSIKVLEAETPGTTLYVLNGRVQSCFGLGCLDFISRGDYEGLMDSARNGEQGGESLIIMALGATLSRQRGILEIWKGTEPGYFSVAFR